MLAETQFEAINMAQSSAFTCAFLAAVSLSAAESRETFDRDVAPVLVKHCLECHNAHEASGGLVLSERDAALRGGTNGIVIRPHDAERSRLLQRIRANEMPPPRQGVQQELTPTELTALEQWIASGADWPQGRVLDLYEQTTDVRGGRDWWSFQPVVRPQVPDIRGPADHVANPVDAFILDALRRAEMSPAPRADRRTLIRRLYFDVLGIPPTPEQIEAFIHDPTEDAWERLIERVLASPQYGERWARHWLDVVRFAETSGYERDQEKPFAWRYRDWVVTALNANVPYDRFVLEQLAGDEIADRTEQTVIATGFLRLGTWNDEPNDPEDYKYERIEDLVHATSTAFLGLTVKCARCHDHKFDPVPQRDYYRMAAVFWPGPIEARDRSYLGGPTAEELGFADVLGWTDLSPNPPPLHLLKKGDRHRPGPVAEPGPLSLFPALDGEFDAPSAVAVTSQRRLQLARWIIDPNNPLTARVMVNRLWLHHFGQGVVRSPDNFGFQGEPPTHPELLDWLAAEVMDSGWDLKQIHRLILRSATWQQASVHPEQEACEERDAGNRLWWRAERRRLDAESLRDALLAASGELDSRIGGPSFKPTIDPAALEGLSRKADAWNASPSEEQRRRSLYIFTQRSLLPPLMTAFDLTDTTLPCGQRDQTTAAPQALALLNNPFVHKRSMELARRVRSSRNGDAARQIELVWRQVLGRPPRDEEAALARNHLQAQEHRYALHRVPDPDLSALASLCHVLLNSNEFLYVD